MHVWPLHAGLVNHEWILGSGSHVIECVCVCDVEGHGSDR